MKLKDVPERHDKIYCDEVKIKNGVQSVKVRMRVDPDGPSKGVLFSIRHGVLFLRRRRRPHGVLRRSRDAVKVVDNVVLDHAMSHSKEWFGKKNARRRVHHKDVSVDHR